MSDGCCRCHLCFGIEKPSDKQSTRGFVFLQAAACAGAAGAGEPGAAGAGEPGSAGADGSLCRRNAIRLGGERNNNVTVPILKSRLQLFRID